LLYYDSGSSTHAVQRTVPANLASFPPQFKFYDRGEHELGLAGQNVPLDMIVGHLDPFYAECRAYGRIAERKRKRPVAVPCYGFIGLSAAQEDFLSETFHVSDWDRPEEEYDRPIADRPSFRALVKELVTDLIPFRKNMVRGMLAHLRSLRNMSVFVRDIRADNYCGGKLVDFSVSWTAPHLMLADGLRDMNVIDEDITEELFAFDKMIEDADIVTPVRATPNKVYTSKLRPRKKIRY